MSDYIKVCATCEHYPNDKHCIGCEWDKNTGDNTKWVSRKVIDRKVIEDKKDYKKTADRFPICRRFFAFVMV